MNSRKKSQKRMTVPEFVEVILRTAEFAEAIRLATEASQPVLSEGERCPRLTAADIFAPVVLTAEELAYRKHLRLLPEDVLERLWGSMYAGRDGRSFRHADEYDGNFESLLKIVAGQYLLASLAHYRGPRGRVVEQASRTKPWAWVAVGGRKSLLEESRAPQSATALGYE